MCNTLLFLAEVPIPRKDRFSIGVVIGITDDSVEVFVDHDSKVAKVGMSP